MVAISGAWWLHSDTLRTILARWDNPGGPWDQQDGHVGVRNQSFLRFGGGLGIPFQSFFDTDGSNFEEVFGVTDFIGRKFGFDARFDIRLEY